MGELFKGIQGLRNNIGGWQAGNNIDTSLSHKFLMDKRRPPANPGVGSGGLNAANAGYRIPSPAISVSNNPFNPQGNLLQKFYENNSSPITIQGSRFTR